MTAEPRNALVACCVGLAVMVGCSSPEFAPVSGVVTYNGQPLSDATVSFRRRDDRQLSYGTTGSDGRFTLKVAGKADQTGAGVGEHVVKVAALSQKSNTTNDPSLGSLAQIGQPTRIEYRIPPRYGDFDSSGLTFVVPPSGSDEANFALEP